MEKTYITPAFVTASEIKQAREKLKMTQKEFAGFVGVSKPTVERWERNDEKITGAISLLVTILNRHPEVEGELALPEKRYPLRLWYYYRRSLCTIIDVDEAHRRVQIANYTDDPIFRAFGRNEHPGFKDYEDFLESRCFPRERDKMKLALQEFDLPFYDPLLIIEKTQGRMAEDDFHIEMERA